MTYVVSDIHGQYNLFMKMLEEINFSDNDEMWVLGDVFDRGKEPIKTLLYIINTPNIHMILGNHEEFMLDFFNRNEMPRNMSEVYEMSMYEGWLQYGGIETIRELKKKYSINTKDIIISYLKNIPLIKKISINNNTFYLAHADLQFYPKGEPFLQQSRDFVLWNTKQMCDLDILKNNTYLVTGHMHQVDSKVLRHENWICVASETNGYKKLGCLRLDDFEEFYVEE